MSLKCSMCNLRFWINEVAQKKYFKCNICQRAWKNFWFITRKVVQLNLHETDLLFRYLSHHLIWHCSSISDDLHRFARHLQHLSAKLFLGNFKRTTLKLFRNKNNFAPICCKFLANLCKSSEILKQYDVKWWVNYRKYGSVSYSFSCKLIL
jgi:hypothetical protein